MKELNEIRNKAIAVHDVVKEAVERALAGWGDDTDKLRVLGYCGEAMMELAEHELKILKLRDETEGQRKIMVAVH